MAIVGCPLFGSRYLRSSMNVQFHACPRFMNHPSWSHITTTIRAPPLPPLKGNSRHMPGESLHAAAPSQCLVIITIIIIINIIIIIIFLITNIIRLEIRIFRHPFSKYPTVRWKWQVRASIGTAKRDIGVCANTDRIFFPRAMRVYDNVYLQMAI